MIKRPVARSVIICLRYSAIYWPLCQMLTTFSTRVGSFANAAQVLPLKSVYGLTTYFAFVTVFLRAGEMMFLIE